MRRKIRIPAIENADGSITIFLSNGQSTTVENIDSDLSNSNWKCVDGAGTQYAHSTERLQIGMHRKIMERVLGRKLGRFELVDHKDRNGLNNRRSNLRLATVSQNSQNAKKRRNSSSPYKGVTWHKKCQKWQAAIKLNGKNYHLGIFENPLDAHEAYKQKAIELFGEYARFE